LEPAQELIGRKLGDPLLARVAPFQVLTHRCGRNVVELAQAIGLQDWVDRVDGGGGAHDGISWSDSSTDGRSITVKESPQQRETRRKKNQEIGCVGAFHP
jgi:hypothetical protein